MTKSVRSRLKAIVDNRRQARRYKTRRTVALVAGLTLETEAGTEIITGRTRDVAESGLSLSLPIADRQQQQRMAANTSTRVVLALPSGTVTLLAKIVHSHLLSAADPGRGMLVGIQITQISPEDQQSYKEYLDSLKSQRWSEI